MPHILLNTYNNVQQIAGSWEAPISPAVNKNDVYFTAANTGILSTYRMVQSLGKGQIAPIGELLQTGRQTRFLSRGKM